jgi:probable rRNA maturation factor
VSHQRIKALNKKFLNRDHVTDVLAFDHCDNGSIKQKPRAIAGDIIISTDAALKNMKTYKTALPQELALYIVHGILHLLGYDDHKAGGIKRMRSKEQEILKSLGTKINKVVK